MKETAFSGVFPLVAALRSPRRRRPVVHDPWYGDAELAALGLDAYHLGEPVDAVIIHTDHPDYAELGASDFPGLTGIVDGRQVLEGSRFAGTPFAPSG